LSEDTELRHGSDELDKLFQAFVQTKGRVTSQQENRLGLAISQQFIKLMGSLIANSSKVHFGTALISPSAPLMRPSARTATASGDSSGTQSAALSYYFDCGR